MLGTKQFQFLRTSDLNVARLTFRMEQHKTTRTCQQHSIPSQSHCLYPLSHFSCVSCWVMRDTSSRLVIHSNLLLQFASVQLTCCGGGNTQMDMVGMEERQTWHCVWHGVWTLQLNWCLKKNSYFNGKAAVLALGEG